MLIIGRYGKSFIVKPWIDMRHNTVPDVITWEFASHPITNVGCVRCSMRETFSEKMSETTVSHLTFTLMENGKNKRITFTVTLN